MPSGAVIPNKTRSKIMALQVKVASVTDNCSEVSMEPFPNFNFGTPDGMHFAVRGCA